MAIRSFVSTLNQSRLFFYCNVVTSDIFIDWDIVSNDARSAIVETVPLTIDTLSKLGVLKTNVLKEYGKRLIKNIKAFIEQNALQVYVQNPEPTEGKSHDEGKEEEEFVPDNEHLRRNDEKTRRAKENTTVLPKIHTDLLIARIKKLVSFLADEEVMNGNQVFCKYSESIKIFLSLRRCLLRLFYRLEYHD
jgi:hypothetical protein